MTKRDFDFFCMGICSTIAVTEVFVRHSCVLLCGYGTVWALKQAAGAWLKGKEE